MSCVCSYDSGSDGAASRSRGRSSSRRRSTSSRRSLGEYQSRIEKEILNAKKPIQVSENQTVTVNGQTGIFVNKSEVDSFRGPLSIDEYKIYDDPNPQIINKKVSGKIEHVQQISVRYLEPPPPPPAGDIIIREAPNTETPAAPPVIIRQESKSSGSGKAVVHRECPPCPKKIACKEITVTGKNLPPPPRKVIIERLPALPDAPGKVCIERWLSLPKQERRVIFKPANNGTSASNPRNVIIEWDAPEVNIRKEFRNLGKKQTDPKSYIKKHGSSLKSASQLPDYARNVEAPSGYTLAADDEDEVPRLVGDLDALKLIDLDREGLSEYKDYLRGRSSGSHQSRNAEARSSSSRRKSSRSCKPKRVKRRC